MCDYAVMVRLGLPESLGKRICQIARRVEALGGSVFAPMLEQAVERIEPLLSAAETSASARDKRAAALRAALDDVRWKPDMLRAALGHKSAAAVSRYLSGEAAIPERIYAVSEVGRAFHRREATLFGFDEKETA